MLRDRHVRTLLFGALLGGSFLLIDQLTWSLSMDVVRLRDWIVGGALAGAVVLAPDAVRARRGAALVVLAAAGIYAGGLSVLGAAILCTGALALGRLGRHRRGLDGGLAVAGLLLAAAIIAQTTVTEALAIWSFFLVQSLHPVFVEGDLIAANTAPPRPRTQEDAFTAARDDILAAIDA